MMPDLIETGVANLADAKPLQSCRVIGLLNNTEVFGQERANIEVFKSLRRQGAQIIVGVNRLHNGGSLRQTLEKHNFETFSMPFGCQWSKKFFRREPWLLPKNLLCIQQCSSLLAKHVRELNATHILLGNPLVYSFIAPYLWRNRRIQLIYRMGDEPPHTSRPNLWIWHRCIRRANHVVANSKFVSSSISKAFGTSHRKINLIYNLAPNGVDDRRPERSRTAASRVLYVGQIAKHKGIEHFIDCAIDLAKQRREWYFDVVGGSVFTKKLEEHLRSQVKAEKMDRQIRFLGCVDDPSGFYESALVLVVPSLFEEPAANVVLEAKRHGVPAIVYPSGGLPELVTDKITGFVCSDKNPTVLLNQISLCLRNPNLCLDMRSACLLESQQRFGRSRFDNAWSSVFGEINAS